MRVTSADQKEGADKRLRTLLKKASAKTPMRASLRWAVNTTPAGIMQIQVTV